jgi:nicotinate-nucleotide--dimethylbenzimidazole phosphoribosyltransferase
MLVFAGDHGAAKAGVSAYPQDVTWQMVENFLAGGAAINVFARQNDLHLAIIDAGVAHDFGKRTGLIDAKIAAGTANYIEEPAMSAGQCTQAIARGAEISRNLAANGCNVVGFGEMGIGNTAAASLITHCLTGLPLAECIGRGTGLDDAGLVRKQALLETALKRYRSAGGSNEPLAVLAEFGGFEIAMMVGAMLGAAEAKMTLLIDGFIVGSAALTATRLAPALADYCVFCHRSAEAGHAAQLLALGAEPLLDLGLRLGEGTGAALAFPLVLASVNFLNEMASFESAGVSDKE